MGFKKEWDDINNWGHGDGVMNANEGWNGEHDRDGLIDELWD